MKSLVQILNRITQRQLADRLNINHVNISIWVKTNHIPKKHHSRIKEIRLELKDAPKR